MGPDGMSLEFLIADRDPLVRDECQRALVVRGHSVEVAANDRECVQRLQQTPPSVLVLDLDLVADTGEDMQGLIHRQLSAERLVVLLTDGHDPRPWSPHLRSLVAGRLPRPRTLLEVDHLADQLHELIEDDANSDLAAPPLSVSGACP